ncbi:hypothetical protein LTR86_006282 [Recurvomyces mirabilis]|nr:hypothetical protein LTR86_006282 [Recurvomyces mirabilis]
MLLPGEGDLEGELEEVSLEENPEYAALSYSWALANGDDSKSEVIHLHCKCSNDDSIHEKEVAITRNLYDGLIRIRTNITKPLPLWVDALCIDQNNSIERQQQVACMAQIYSKASLVIVWIGNDLDGDEALAAEMISEAKYPKAAAELGDGVMYLTNAFESLLAQRYFRRRWIVQELRHAIDVVVCWGEYRADLKSLRIALQFHQDRDGSAAPEILSLFDEAYRHSLRNILVCLASYEDMECSDPRDRLYSLLSLYSECTLEADYSVSMEEVGRRLARYMCHQGNTEVLLRNCKGALRATDRFADRRDPLDAGTSSTWAIELGGKFVLPGGVEPYGNIHRTHQQRLQERWQRLLRHQNEHFSAMWKAGAPYKKPLWTEDLRTIVLTLHLFGTVGKWTWGPNKKHSQRTGYRELNETSTPAIKAKVVGSWRESDVNQDDLRSGDLVCSYAHPTGFWVIVRIGKDHPLEYRIVGMCQLQTMDSDRWCHEPVARRDYCIS